MLRETEVAAPALHSAARPSGVRVHAIAGPPDHEWERIVAAAPANLAAAPAWHGVISTAYRHTPLYLCASQVDKLTGVLPAFVIRHRLFGTTVASMPFLDGGGPLGGAPEARDALAHHLLAQAASCGADRAEIRCHSPLQIGTTPSLEKVTLVLSLPGDAEHLWKGLDAKVRNQIRKAERSGLTVAVGGKENLDAFYRVFCVNMRDLGSPVHARALFTALLEHFGPAARVAVVRRGQTCIGGLVAIAHGDTLYVPWASTLRAHTALCPNMLLYWETLRLACSEGFHRFDFGRSSRDSGTYRFKRQWGAMEAQLYWYTIPMAGKGSGPITKEDRRWAAVSALWKRLPVWFTRLVGPRLRKYLTQ
jgi:FemAB-related protein (PEP-CTERM system-associated)